MNILGIGPMEIVLVLILGLIIFGPKDLQKAGKSMGKWLYKLTHSESWRTVQQTSQELKNLPNRLMRESGLEDLEKSAKGELQKANIELKQAIPTEKDQ
jgi:Sec-independent protein translocase protein TatA